ncbi:MAG: hypothetical protein KTR16_14930 [Acidiferrobacterales bacterium]|nr:hypothetical protein [Acidiferrobacterales bacterium]
MINDKGVSYSFDNGTNLYQKVSIDAAKSFYLQRASIVIEEKYAGRWNRELGHSDRNVLHPSTG